MSNQKDVIHTKIWKETPEDDNPFAAKTCYCAGYDVYGDLLGKASWIEYLYLLFKLERPTKEQTELLEGIAVAIANPGPRDLSVRAAMNGGAAESKAAGCLIAGLASGAGQFGGAREVFLSMQLWMDCLSQPENQAQFISNYQKPEQIEVWPDIDHIPGFDPYGVKTAKPVLQTLEFLASKSSGEGALHWLKVEREIIEECSGAPLSMVGVVSAAFLDLDFSIEQAEMIFLLLRLPGAAAHSLEQSNLGLKKYPFFMDGLKLQNDPGPPDEE